MKTRTEIIAWLNQKGHNLEECARCGEDGLPEEYADKGDEDFVDILERYRDSDSRYDGDSLCSPCTLDEDMRVHNREAFIEHHGRYPKPWER